MEDVTDDALTDHKKTNKKIMIITKNSPVEIITRALTVSAATIGCLIF